MSYESVRSIGSTFLISLAIVGGASGSARLYKENMEAEKAFAAQVKSSALVCFADETVRHIP